jgi:hypothetical protein
VECLAPYCRDIAPQNTPDGGKVVVFQDVRLSVGTRTVDAQTFVTRGMAMDAEPEQDLQAARHAVEHRFGQCVLLLQRYERLLKIIVSHYDSAGPVAELQTITANRIKKNDGKTLGALVAEFAGSVVVPLGTEGGGPDRDDAPSFSFRIQIVLSPEDYQQTETDLRDLVKLRNDLVHHFIDTHDFSTIDRCRRAKAALDKTHDRVAEAYRGLQQVLDLQVQTFEEMRAFLATPEFRDSLAGGLGP